MYVVFKGVTGELPWDTDLNQISFEMEKDEMIQVYKTLRIKNYNAYLSQLDQIFQTIHNKFNLRTRNPYTYLLEFLLNISEAQQ
jgi:hypothetical protein